MSEETEIYRKIHRLITNPKTRDMKIKAYESIIYHALAKSKEARVALDDVKRDALDAFGLQNLSELVLNDSMRNLMEQGAVFQEGDVWVLDPAFSQNLKNRMAENQSKHEEFLGYVVSSIQNRFDAVFSEEETHTLKDIIERVLFDVLENHTETVMAFYDGKPSFLRAESLQEIIDTCVEDTQWSDEEMGLQMPDAVFLALRKELSDPSDSFAIELREIANRHFMFKMLVHDPSMKAVERDLFNNCEIFVDTNILMSLLCEASLMRDVTIHLLNEAKNLGARIYVSNWTIREFQQSLTHASWLYESYKSKRVDVNLVENEIVRTYFEIPEKERNWLDYVNSLSAGISKLKEDGMVEEVECDEMEIFDEIPEVTRVVGRELSHRNIERHPSIIKHDVRMLLTVQRRRKEEEVTIGTTWFLSRDYRLIEIEKKNIYSLDFPFESIISCEILFEILLPFVSVEMDQLEASKAFSRMVASSILPLPEDVLDAYVAYVSSEIKIEESEVETLKAIVSRTHVRNALEEAFVNRDAYGTYSVILEELREGLKEKKEADEYQRIINRLVSQVRLFREGLPETFFDRDEFSRLKGRVLKAQTNDEKGKSLEDLVAYMVDTINGLDVIEKRLRLEAEEIDLLVSNGAFVHWGDPLIVECKNWSEPVGRPELVNFHDKMETVGAKTGIFVASNGITGDDHRGARTFIRQKLKSEGIRILVLTWEDIESISSGDELLELLKLRYYEPSRLP